MAPQYNMRVAANAVIVRASQLLVVEFNDVTGPHFNLPGGGIEAYENMVAGLQREVREETCAEVIVGPLLLVTEYFPPRYQNLYGPLHSLGLFFRCELSAGSEPHLPAQPDPHQVGVRWIPLATLAHQPLLPAILTTRLPSLLVEPQPSLFVDDVGILDPAIYNPNRIRP
jgi:8-oxo-dGTP pyrophosphatase MutT (NUDIX family)